MPIHLSFYILKKTELDTSKLQYSVTCIGKVTCWKFNTGRYRLVIMFILTCTTKSETKTKKLFKSSIKRTSNKVYKEQCKFIHVYI